MAHVVQVGNMKYAYKIFVKEHEGRNFLQWVKFTGEMLLRWVLKK